MTNKQTIDGVSGLRALLAEIYNHHGTTTDHRDRICALLMETPAAQPQGEVGPVAFVCDATTTHHGCPEGCGDTLSEWLPVGTELYAHADAGEVERLRADLASANADKAAYAQNAIDLRAQLPERDALLREIANKCNVGFAMRERLLSALSTSAEPKPAQPYPNRICHVEYTAHPHLCGCTQGDEEAQRLYDERYGKASTEPKPRGEAVAFVNEDDDGLFLEFIYGENGNPLRCGDKLYAEQSAPASSQPKDKPIAWASPDSLGGIRWRPQALDGLADGAPLYCWPNEQSAPLATEAAKAFTKGFNTLESGGGKYRINMQFQSREDAWGAFNVLARLKQLNTPQ